MAALNVQNRTLFIGDNLPVLRGINSESVDLIATDPPFNKGVKAFEGITKAGDNVSYKDVWTWGDVQAEWTNEILGNHGCARNDMSARNDGWGPMDSGFRRNEGSALRGSVAAVGFRFPPSRE